MNKKTFTKFAALFALASVIVAIFYFAQPSDTETFTGVYSGTVSIKIEAIDENGLVITPPKIKPLVFVSNGSRISLLRLNVTWSVYDIQEGLDTTSFMFKGNLTILDTVTWTNQTWAINSTGTPLSSQVLNSSNVWSFNLISTPLNLQTEANKHRNDRTDFAISFALNWEASMYDTIGLTTETEQGTLSTSAAIYYVRSFRIQVR
jgi:hypothetical protein